MDKQIYFKSYRQFCVIRDAEAEHVINQKSIEIEKEHLFRFKMIHHQQMACHSIYFINQQTFFSLCYKLRQ